MAERIINPDELLNKLGINEGFIVLEVSFGQSNFTIPLARRVSQGGRLYVFDAQNPVEPNTQALNSIAASKEHTLIKNVKGVKGNANQIFLPQNSVQMALLPFTLNKIQEKTKLLQLLLPLTVQDGILIILEWTKNINKESVSRYCKESGWWLEQHLALYPLLFAVIASKKR